MEIFSITFVRLILSMDGTNILYTCYESSPKQTCFILNHLHIAYNFVKTSTNLADTKLWGDSIRSKFQLSLSLTSLILIQQAGVGRGKWACCMQTATSLKCSCSFYSALLTFQFDNNREKKEENATDTVTD